MDLAARKQPMELFGHARVEILVVLPENDLHGAPERLQARLHGCPLCDLVLQYCVLTKERWPDPEGLVSEDLAVGSARSGVREKLLVLLRDAALPLRVTTIRAPHR